MSSLVNIQFRKDDTWRTHRDQTMTAHLAAEAAHDVDAIMATFSPDAEVIVNGQIFNTPEAIRNFHLSLGSSSVAINCLISSVSDGSLCNGGLFSNRFDIYPPFSRLSLKMPNGKIERQAIASKSTPKYYNLVRSLDVLYTDRLTIILFIVDDRRAIFGTKAENRFAMLA
jgi:hypothetical protein